jgi:two-component system CheB/CheR fusion protein
MTAIAGQPIAILLIDDNPDDRNLAAREIRKTLPSARVDEVGEPALLDALLASGARWDVVVTDYALQWSTGLDVFRRLQRERPEVPVIMFTDSGNEEIAVAALHEGMADYITKAARHYARVPYAAHAAADRWRRRRQAEEANAALRHKEMLLQLALGAAKLETWELDLASGNLALHGRAPASFGAARTVPLEQIRSALHEEDADRVRSQFDAAVRGSPFDVEFRARVDGRERWLRAAGISNSPDRFVGVLEEVTERRAMLEHLRDVDRRKDQFIATLGHELRNPLAPVRYAAKLLHRSEEPAVRRAATIIDRQVDGMSALLDQLLDVTRITHGLIELKLERVDLRDLVRAAAEDAQPWAESTGRHLEVATPGTEVVVAADRVRLKQVLDNLLNNAIKFTSPGGGRIRLVLDTDGQVARVRVIDDGIGIPPAMLNRIFEPLVQVQAGPAATHPGGLGIGLALVRNVMALHRGDAHAESAGDKRGATFVVSLPLAGETSLPDPTAARSGRAAPSRGLRVLVADDYPDAAELMAQTLQLDGHTVRTALRGDEAQAEADRWRPDVLVLDIAMPGMAGDDVARWVRTQPWGAAVKLIALTGWGRSEDSERLLAAGFDMHLVKPIEPDKLLDAVRVRT